MKLVPLVLGFVVAAHPVFADTPVSLPTEPGPYQVAAADLDGDGYADLLAPCRGDLLAPEEARPANDTLTVYLTAGKPLPHLRRDFGVGFGPYTAAAGDIDGDGLPDAAVANFQANDGRDLSILWGAEDRNALFEPETAITVEGAPHTYIKSFRADGRPVYPSPGLTSLALADFDEDGRTDIVAVAWSSDFFVVLRNEGERRFSQKRYDLLPGPRDVAVADFDGDGHLDLAFTIYSCNMLQAFRGDGHGNFIEWTRMHSQGHVPYPIKTGDLDRDGRPDLVAANRGPSDDAVAFLNTGTGFRFAGSYPTDTPVTAESTTDEIRDVLLTDIDGDGILDLLAACHVSHKVISWRGTGDSAFGKAFTDHTVRTFPGKGPRSLARLDDALAVVCYDSSEILLIPLAPDADATDTPKP